MTPRPCRKQHGPGRIGAAAAAAVAFSVLIGAAQAEDAPEAREPFKMADTQFVPVAFSDIEGWSDDDHDAAFHAFLKSCRAILRSSASTREARPLLAALYTACRTASDVKLRKPGDARAFFETNFRPVRISPLGETDGFLTGYYEPIVEGTRKKTDEFKYPLYRKPPTLLPGGKMLAASYSAQKKSKKGGGKRRLVQFHDRAAIDDGVLSGRNLEICYLKDPIDAFFIHIQGSVRVRLDEGKTLRLNYLAQNGHPYVAVGRFLIERKIVPKDEMSMDRIRQWMEANPDEGRELRRRNKSYIFFRETDLADDQEPSGAQGVPLTPGRSIAVDRNLHIYGTPFFIEATLPIETEQPTTPFRHLMVAQDTGGAIIGPARADLYFGAGDEAGSISGRMRHPGRFVMLFPNDIDPVAAGATMPLPPPKVPYVEVAAKPEKPAKAGKKAKSERHASKQDKPAAKVRSSAKRKP
ncbi:MAG: lytic transglycosylase [Alphaproteobacteria bacterium]|nr:lytic transglycosylase [Alphaproteobacteria bacterium]